MNTILTILIASIGIIIAIEANTPKPETDTDTQETLFV
jgi:hypothetical protein